MQLLVIEGAPLIRRTILSALESARHEVVAIDRGRRALDALDDVAPDAVIIGTEVVGMSGAALAMHIRCHRDHHHTPLVLVSGRRSYEDVLKAVHCGVDEYIVLPFTGDLLLTKLHQAFRRKSNFLPSEPKSAPLSTIYLNSQQLR